MCGENTILSSALINLNSIKKMLDSYGEMKHEFIKLLGDDVGSIQARQMLEGTIGDIASHFQKFAQQKYKSITGKEVKVNKFQIVEEGDRLFKKATGTGYADYINKDEYSIVELMFQRRHILEHNNGIIDERYLQKTNDTKNRLGARLVVQRESILNFLKIIIQLVEQLQKL